ncbi:hypothetical protein OAO01_02750 [Oligoflexia bacterium]|nr:hypothetical protein [Oligoflexia bacterium]
MQYSYPIPTEGDGELIELSDLQLPDKKILEESPNLAVATATGVVRWSKEDIGSEALAFLKGRDYKMEGGTFVTRRHLRSFLAQTGMDVAKGFGNLRFVDDFLEAELEMRFLVSREVKGEPVFPHYQALAEFRKTMEIRILQLIFMPDEAEPLNETQLGAAIGQGKIEIPDGFTISPDGRFVEFALHEGQYDAKVACAIPHEEWPTIFAGSKRALREHQEQIKPASNFLNEGFDLRRILLRANANLSLLLDTVTNNEDVLHSSSPYLELVQRDIRFIELQAQSPNILASDVRPRGQFFERQEDTRVSASVGIDLSTPAATIGNGGLSRAPIDQIIAQEHGPIADWIRMVAKSAEHGVHGVVLGANDVHFIPRRADVIPEHWARVAATKGEAICERTLRNIITEDVQHPIRTHQGAAALQHMLRVNASAHYETNLVISEILPTPQVMEQLVAAGIGSFFATDLRQKVIGDERGFSRFSLEIQAIERLRELSQGGMARVYWLPPTGELRKLVGPTFVGHSQEERYRNLDFVLAVYCSHLPPIGGEAKLEEQLETFMGTLNSLGCYVAVSSGASTGVMPVVMRATNRYPNIASLGISTLFYNQEPDFTPDYITICAGGGRRGRQEIITVTSDMRAALNSGMGGSGEILEDGVDSKFGFVTPAPIGIVDLAGLDNWRWLLKHIEHGSTIPEGPVDRRLIRPWCRNLFCESSDLNAFFKDHMRPYLDNPLAWMEENQVPKEVQRMGLEAHVRHTAYMGRRVSSFLRPAIEHFGIPY